MLRRALEVGAITASLAIVAGIFALLDLGASRAIPAIAGASLAGGLVFLRRLRSYPTALIAALCTAIAAFAIDWFILFVLGAGHPELREIRKGPFYQALIVSIFGAIAALDVRSSGAPDARS